MPVNLIFIAETKKNPPDEKSQNVLSSDCLRSNIDYGPDFTEFVDVADVEDCYQACRSHSGCAGFSSAAGVGCYLYTKNMMRLRDVSEEKQIESGDMSECDESGVGVTEYGENYQDDEFRPVCARARPGG